MTETKGEEKRIEEKKEDASEPKQDSEEGGKKKRTADRQITKDDGEDDGEDEGAAKLSQPFEKASEEVLSKRKILKVKRPAANGGSKPSSSNPFAATKLAASDSKSSDISTKVFGGGSSFSGFGGFGSSSSTSGGFASSSGGGFGSAFGSSSGFGSTTSTSGGFGTKASSSSADGDSSKTSSSLFGKPTGSAGFSFGFAKTSSPKSTEAATPAAVALPENVKLSTGEEDEVKMHEVRCKSYKLVQVTQKEPKEAVEEPQESANPSVKPSSNFENKNQETSKSADEKGSDEKRGPQHRWQEVGTGPLKILRSTDHPDKFRMVQRQESSKNGPAHKVIINDPLWKEVTCTKLSEKQLRLTTPGSGVSSTYTLKFSEASDASACSECIKDICAEAKSCFASSN